MVGVEKLVSTAKNYLRLLRTNRLDFYRNIISDRISKAQKLIDDSFHVSAVQEAQTLVTEAEQKFLEARRRSVEVKETLEGKQSLLKDARKKLDRCPREDANYLALVSEEHSILIEEQALSKKCEKNEQIERYLFTEYSNAVRLSHEKERERAQKTKYWSIIGSVSGTILGFFGSSLITYYRLKQIKDIASPNQILKSIEDLQSELQNQNVNNYEKTSKLIEEVMSNQKTGDVSVTESNGNMDFEIDKQPEKFHQTMDVDQTAQITDSLIENNNKKFQDLQLDIQQLIESTGKCLKNDIMEHFDFQRLFLQENVSKKIDDITSNIELLRIKKNADCVIEKELIKAKYDWKEDVQLLLTVTSFTFLLYLVIDSKS